MEQINNQKENTPNKGNFDFENIIDFKDYIITKQKSLTKKQIKNAFILEILTEIIKKQYTLKEISEYAKTLILEYCPKANDKFINLSKILAKSLLSIVLNIQDFEKCLKEYKS